MIRFSFAAAYVYTPAAAALIDYAADALRLMPAAMLLPPGAIFAAVAFAPLRYAAAHADAAAALMPIITLLMPHMP